MNPDENPILWKAHCANGEEIAAEGLLMKSIKDRDDVSIIDLLYKGHTYRADMVKAELWVDTKLVLRLDVLECADVKPIALQTRTHRADWAVEKILSATVGFDVTDQGVNRKATIVVAPDGSYNARLV